MSTPLVISVINLKPGTGKTTTAVFLAAAYRSLGLKVLLVDADPGGSALRWSDLIQPTGFPWVVVGMPQRTISHQLQTMMRRTDYDVVIIDCPQLEDHQLITEPALKFAGDQNGYWLVPCAPAGIELDRTMAVKLNLDRVENLTGSRGRRVALLNRTNTGRRTKGGPDAETAEILTEQGYEVLREQVRFNDRLYRQSFGTLPDLDGSPFVHIAETLLKDAAA